MAGLLKIPVVTSSRPERFAADPRGPGRTIHEGAPYGRSIARSPHPVRHRKSSVRSRPGAQGKDVGRAGPADACSAALRQLQKGTVREWRPGQAMGRARPWIGGGGWQTDVECECSREFSAIRSAATSGSVSSPRDPGERGELASPRQVTASRSRRGGPGIGSSGMVLPLKHRHPLSPDGSSRGGCDAGTNGRPSAHLLPGTGDPICTGTPSTGRLLVEGRAGGGTFLKSTSPRGIVTRATGQE